MLNQSSNFATCPVSGDTLVRCLSCNAWTSSTDEVCEVCEERGITRSMIDADAEEAAFYADHDEESCDHDFENDYDFDDGRFDFQEGYIDEY